MGLGSQRAGLELDDERVLESYTVVRDAAPDAFIYGNLGAAQLREYDIEMVEQAVEMIDADALAVHLNFLQEATQPEGDVDGRNCVAAIERVSEALSVPIIVKETGNGISGETARELTAAGVDALDVAGKGGTTWSGIEALSRSSRERAATETNRHPVPRMGHSNRCKHDRVCCRTRLRHCEWWCPNGIGRGKSDCPGCPRRRVGETIPETSHRRARCRHRTRRGPDRRAANSDVRHRLGVDRRAPAGGVRVARRDAREYVEQRTSSE